MIMAKAKQIMKVTEGGKTFSVVRHDGCNNPYWIYRHTWGVKKSGYGYAEHRRLEVKYADFVSCLYFLTHEF